MGKKGLVILSVIGLIFLISGVFAISNPSAVYCESLGYSYEINHTASGDVGICSVSKSIKLDAWDFYEGKVGQQYSYCARNGYQTQEASDGKNAFSENYTACVTNIGKGKSATNKSASDLMNLSNKLRPDKLPSDEMKKFSGNTNGISRITGNIVRGFTGFVVGSFTAKLPDYFDWRNNSGNWLTPIKNQGSCGSCWAFATVGVTESKIKIARQDSGFDVDLAEQDLVSCGIPYGFYSGAGGCEGATLEDPLNYMNTTGITDEACLPYTASDESCSNKCASSDKRLWKIDNYGYVPLTRNDMKNYLLTKGPIIAGIYMAGSFVNGVYTCSNPGSNLNHAVVIVGYNDTGKYWIVRNSWGANWNGDGYFNVGYGKCNIETYPMYIDLSFNSSVQKINIADSKVALGSEEGKIDYTFSKDNLSMLYKENCSSSDCSGYDITDIFSLKKASSIDLIAYQSSSDEKETSLSYFNQNSNSWEALGTIPESNYLIKYTLCDNQKECSIFGKELSLEYTHPKSQSSVIDTASVDWLYLEARVIDCNDNWTLNSTWSACQVNDMQYKNYYDLNSCYKNTTYPNTSVSQSCDYCTPNIIQVNASCQTNDTFVSWYNDTNNCFGQTNLSSDSVPSSQAFACDYCTPNWTGNDICNPDDSVTTWYNDTRSCFAITNLSSDLSEKPANQTLPSSCIYNNSYNPINHTILCGDGVCNEGESCSSCASDCGACPSNPGNSGSGGGGGGGGSSNSITTQTTTQTQSSNTNNANNNQNSQQNPSSPISGQSVNTQDTNSPKREPFSLTGLITQVQDSSSAKFFLIGIIAVGAVLLFFVARRIKFSRKQAHKDMMSIFSKGR